MNTPRLPIYECIVYGFTTYFKHLWLFLKFTAALFAVAGVFLASLFLAFTPTVIMRLIELQSKMQESLATELEMQELLAIKTLNMPGFIIFGLIAVVVSLVLWAGIMKFIYDVHTTGTPRLRTLFAPGARLVVRLMYCQMLCAVSFVLTTLIIGKLALSFSGVLRPNAGSATLLVAILLVATGLFISCYILIRMSMSWWVIIDQQVGVIMGIKKSMALTKGHVFRLFMLLITLAIIAQLLNMLIIGIIVATPVVLLSILRAYSWLKEDQVQA